MTHRPGGTGARGPKRPWTDTDVATLAQLKSAHTPTAEVARHLGRTFASVELKVTALRARGALPLGRCPIRVHRPLEAAVTAKAEGPRTREWSVADRGERATLTQMLFEPVRTLEDLCTICEVNALLWEVVGFTCNAWGGGTVAEPRTLYQVKAAFRRRSQAPVHARRGLIDGLKRHIKPLRPISRHATESGYLYVATMGEPHLGKMAWAPETSEHYDLHIALERVRQSHRHLMQRAAGLRPEKVALIVGDDFFTADNTSNTTTAGTPQEVDGRYRKVFRAGVSLLREVIEGWRGIAPVSVWIKPGNHDTVQTWHAGEVLAAMYALTDDVEVVNPDRLRHYQQWGCCLIGLTHGDKEKDEKLPMLMAHEAKEAWAVTTCRVWLTGHLHTLKAKTHRAVVRPLTSDVHEEVGVTIRRCRSLSGTDSWHHQLGYVGNLKGAEGFAFHRAYGETDIHTALVAA